MRGARTAIFFRAVEIADLMFSLSMLEHGAITPAMTEEAIRAVIGYLRTHLPATLPRRIAGGGAFTHRRWAQSTGIYHFDSDHEKLSQEAPRQSSGPRAQFPPHRQPGRAERSRRRR